MARPRSKLTRAKAPVRKAANKARPKTKAATKPAKSKPAKPAKLATTAKTKPAKKTKPTKPAKSAPKARTKPTKQAAPRNGSSVPSSGVPIVLMHEGSGATASGAVMRLVESTAPIAALREYLDATGEMTVQQSQVALGSAQMLLLPIAQEHRGGPEVKQLLDLVLSHWADFFDATGFHAQEFLRNALAAVGTDRERVIQLAMLVPADATPELRFNLACAYAVAGEREAMLRAVRSALRCGSSPEAFLRDADFDGYRDDPELRSLLERATPPEIDVDIRPHVVIVRAAIDTVLETLQRYGEAVTLEPPATLDTILAAEHAGKIQLPNDYRALLTISDGLKMLDHQFLGTIDYRTETLLAKRARDYLEMSARYGARGIEDCVPLANWGQPNDWLLYDPFGRYRGGEPGIVLTLDTDEQALDGVAAALEQFDEVARDLLNTN